MEENSGHNTLLDTWSHSNCALYCCGSALWQCDKDGALAAAECLTQFTDADVQVNSWGNYFCLLTLKCLNLCLQGSTTCFIFFTTVICWVVAPNPGPTQRSFSFWICLNAAATSLLQTTGLQVNPCRINKRATAPLGTNRCTVCSCGSKSCTMLAASGETVINK